MSSGSNESSGTGGCHMCATAFTADTIIHSTSTLFLTNRVSIHFSHKIRKKKHIRCMRTETALETLMVKSEEKRKKSYRFLFRWLVGSEYFWSVGCSTRGPNRVCVWHYVCGSLLSLSLVYLNYIFRHILHSLFRLRQHFASFLWWLTFCLL